ncbi:hypothetical protein [Streptomyces sp. NPDC002044]|uniref:hypothetical protein n=1 Tax=Streptomyces sp. NPDC002044 TaxID=3154662 RepID=UPI003333A369
MTVGFRPTRADSEIIDAHKRPEESTSDVLRRALRALDRQKWDDQARQDMERLAASTEDLSDEPDDWSYGIDGSPVDRITPQGGTPAEPWCDVIAEAAGEAALHPSEAGTAEPVMQSFQALLRGYLAPSERGLLAAAAVMPDVGVFTQLGSLTNHTELLRRELRNLGIDVTPTLALAGLGKHWPPPSRGPSSQRTPPQELSQPSRGASWRVAHLRTLAARRAGKR